MPRIHNQVPYFPLDSYGKLVVVWGFLLFNKLKVSEPDNMLELY